MANTKTEAQRIAQEIADQLFRNGDGEEADQLQLHKHEESFASGRTRYLSGWCKQAVADAAAIIIAPHLPPLPTNLQIMKENVVREALELRCAQKAGHEGEILRLQSSLAAVTDGLQREMEYR